MKIALIGGTGFVGSAVLKEALDRGHSVTAISRNTGKIDEENPLLRKVEVDVTKIEELEPVLKGHDVVISAFNSGWENPNIYKDYLTGAKAIQEAVKRSEVKRLLVVGGAGSLFTADNVKLIDTPMFPEEIKPGALAASDYLDILKKEEEIDWTFFSPAPGMFPGNPPERKGTYRTGSDYPVTDAEGKSDLSVADAAVVLVDEAEQAQFIRKRFTAAY